MVVQGRAHHQEPRDGHHHHRHNTSQRHPRCFLPRERKGSVSAPAQNAHPVPHLASTKRGLMLRRRGSRPWWRRRTDWREGARNESRRSRSGSGRCWSRKTRSGADEKQRLRRKRNGFGNNTVFRRRRPQQTDHHHRYMYHRRCRLVPAGIRRMPRVLWAGDGRRCRPGGTAQGLDRTPLGEESQQEGGGGSIRIRWGHCWARIPVLRAPV